MLRGGGIHDGESVIWHGVVYVYECERGVGREGGERSPMQTQC